METGANELGRQSLNGWKRMTANTNAVYQGFPDIRRGWDNDDGVSAKMPVTGSDTRQKLEICGERRCKGGGERRRETNQTGAATLSGAAREETNLLLGLTRVMAGLFPQSPWSRLGPKRVASATPLSRNGTTPSEGILRRRPRKHNRHLDTPPAQLMAFHLIDLDGA